MQNRESDEVSDAPDRGIPDRPLTAGARREATRRTQPTVLDASALAALLFDEPGADVVAEAVAAGAVMSAVNVSEVVVLLLQRGHDPNTILAPVLEQVIVEAFGVEDAVTAASFSPDTAARGLSAGDRACLALAKRLDVPALTAEHSWAELSLNVAVELIR